MLSKKGLYRSHKIVCNLVFFEFADFFINRIQYNEKYYIRNLPEIYCCKDVESVV